MIVSLKQKKIKFKPRIKLNHNIYIMPNQGLIPGRGTADDIWAI